MECKLWLPRDGYDPFTESESAICIYSTNHSLHPAQGIPEGYNQYGTIIAFPKTTYRIMFYINVYGSMAVYTSSVGAWKEIKMQS